MTMEKIIRGKERIHPLLGFGIYSQCPICGGGDLVYSFYDGSIKCLQCKTLWLKSKLDIDHYPP